MQIETPKGSALAPVKPSPQASALRLCSPSLGMFRASSLPLRGTLCPSLQGWAIPLGLTLATPDLAGQAGVAGCNPKLHFRKEKLL